MPRPVRGCNETYGPTSILAQAPGICCGVAVPHRRWPVNSASLLASTGSWRSSPSDMA